jgi:predicted negative regulator of RcsB-dependent stress response
MSQIRGALLHGDNRLKQGGQLDKARESYKQALALAQNAGLGGQIINLIELRLDDLRRLEEAPLQPDQPEA